MSITRRHFAFTLFALAAPALESCKHEARCVRCGMVLDRTSRWYVEAKLADGSTLGFDSPKCAFTIARTRNIEPSRLTFRSYYSQSSMTSEALVFGLGSDVLGPMGEDLIPLEPDLASKFQREHLAKKMLHAEEITRELVEIL